MGKHYPIKKSLVVAVIAIFVFISVTPTIIADNKTNNNQTDIYRLILHGFVIFPFYHDDMVTFFAIRVHYIEITGTERNSGIWFFEWVTLPAKDVHLYGKLFIFYTVS